MSDKILSTSEIAARVRPIAEELRAALEKEIDVFEISEINTDSAFYNTIMKERLQVA